MTHIHNLEFRLLTKSYINNQLFSGFKANFTDATFLFNGK